MMRWWRWVLIAYFGPNLILAILAMLIGFGLEDAGKLIVLFIKTLFFGVPLIIFYAIGALID